jgi:hypothetical protein
MPDPDGAAALFTTSVCPGSISAWPLDLTGTTIVAMDLIAILLGVLMFSALLALVWGIERI